MHYSKESCCGYISIRKSKHQSKDINKGKEGHCVILKGSIHQEDIMILSTYPPNNRISKYMKQKLIDLQRPMNQSKTAIRDFNINLSIKQARS